MKKFFNALARPFVSSKTFHFGEGNRTAVVKSRRILIGQKVTSEFKKTGANITITSNATNISVGFRPGKALEKEKQAAQDWVKSL